VHLLLLQPFVQSERCCSPLRGVNKSAEALAWNKKTDREAERLTSASRRTALSSAAHEGTGRLIVEARVGSLRAAPVYRRITNRLESDVTALRAAPRARRAITHGNIREY